MKRSTTLLTACLCAAGSASAAEWSAVPQASWSVDHDSNRNLNENTSPSQGALVQLDLLLKRATGSGQYELQPHLGWQRYTDDTVQNTDNQSLRAAGTWTRLRSMFNLEAVTSRDTNLNNEIADTGIATGSTKRTNQNVSFRWMQVLSTRNQLTSQLSYLDVDYESDRDFRLQGYKYPTISLTGTHQWSDRVLFTLNTYASRLLSDLRGADSDSYGLTLGFTRDLTTRIKLSMQGGVSRQESFGQAQSGYLGRFELTREDTLGDWRLFASRNVSASGYGVLVTRDEYGLQYDYRFRPHWRGSFVARALNNQDVAQGIFGGSGERGRYQRAETSLSWQFDRDWHINASTSYTRASQFGRDEMADGWRASLAAIWTPQPKRLSR